MTCRIARLFPIPSRLDLASCCKCGATNLEGKPLLWTTLVRNLRPVYG